MMMFYITNFNTESDKNKLIKICDKYDLISLDIFDTTLFRLTESPIDVFRYLSEFAKDKGIGNFQEKRIRAQAEAELEKKDSANLDDIYQIISWSYSIREEVCDEIKDKEIEIEKNCIVLNPQILELVEWGKKNKKQICFTSDMYFSSETLREILMCKGIEGDIDIYVSNEYSATKANGRLFKVLRKKYPNKRIIHIGDVIWSDALNPYIYGKISGVLYRSKREDIYDKCLMSLGKNKSVEYQWGYNCLSPVLFEYCKWIYNNYEKNKMDRILFLTREGAYFQHLFNLLYGNKIKNNELFYISRRSIVVALSYLKWDIAIDFFQSTRCTIEEAASMYHLEKDSLCELLEINRIKNNESFKNVVQQKNISDELKKLCYSYAEEQYHLLKNYINQFNFRDGEKIAIVDIGWRGTMQFYLQSILKHENINVKLLGMYFGEYGEMYKDCPKIGFLCSSRNLKYYNDLINATYLFEHVLMPNIGTTLGYSYKDGKVLPVCRDIEKNNTISILQKGVDDAFEIMRNHEDFLHDKHAAMSTLFDSLRQPSCGLADSLGEIQWSDVDEIRYIAKPKNKFFYLSHPQKFIYDMQRSGWNTGFLLRLFKVKLPYFNIYCLMKKLSDL